MRTRVHRVFQHRMVTLRKWLTTIDSIAELGAVTFPAGSATHLRKARKAQTAIRKLGTAISIVPYEGAFLFACAEYELAVRELVEVYADSVRLKVKRFELLDEKLRKRHLEQSAAILTELHHDRFRSSGLTELQIVQRLLLCLDPSTPDYGFELNQEAISYCRNNYDWKNLKLVFQELGITELIDKVVQRKGLRDALGGLSVAHARNALIRSLDDMMLMRNRIIHRNSSSRSPSHSDVRRASLVLEELVLSLHSVLQDHFRNL